MRRLPVFLFAAVTCISAHAVLLAQQDALPVVTEGSRVRLLVPTSPNETFEGTIVSFTENHLVLDPTRPNGVSGQVRLNWEEVERLEVSLGQRSNAVKGALIGMGSGAAVGLITAFIWSGGGEAEYSGAAYAVLSGIGAGVGLWVGFSIGRSSSTEFWREVSLDQITVGPVAGRVGVGLRLRV